MQDVIVVGAGVGGLSCAAFLAKAGLDVLVLEAQDRVGGACQTTERDGFCFEDGALWLSMDYACRGFFAELGADFDALVPTTKLVPSTRCLLPDGETFQFTPDPEAVAAEIGRLSPADVDRFRQFMAMMTKKGEFISGDLYNKPMTWRTVLDPRLWSQAGFLLGSSGGLIRRTFRDERVQLAFSRPTLYLGLPPSRCPAPFAISTYGEVASGSFYPHGGMGRIPAALLQILRGFGGTVRTREPVEKIMVEDRRVVGVHLKSGETVRARAIVSNVHVQPTYLEMVGREHLRARTVRWLESLQLSLSYFGVQLGLDYVVKGPANIPSFPRLVEMDAFWQGIVTQVPTRLYPNVAITPAEAEMAPPGRSVVCIYHAVPYRPGTASWDSVKEEFADRLVNEAEAKASLALHGHVVTQRIRTPADFERECLLPSGAMYGLAPTLWQSGPFRPANRSPWLKGLYLTGHTTQPGLGVASVMASGAMTAREVLAETGSGQTEA